MSSIAPSVFLVVLFAAAMICLPPLHPIQMYSAPWAVATTLYALKLLPYRTLSWSTVALICGSALIFSVAVLASECLGSRRWSHTKSTGSDWALPGRAVAAKYAAWVALLLGTPLFLVFLTQTASRFGLTSTLLDSKSIRDALVSQPPPRSSLYEFLAFPAAALWSLSAVLATNPAAKRRCLLACACAVGSLYFLTGREPLVNALIVSVVIQLMTRERPVNGRHIAMALGALASGAVVIFVGIGALGGHTFNRSGIETFDNVFARHQSVSVLALPYEDVSAPVAALDVQLSISSTWGRMYGCATAAYECTLFHHMGLNVKEAPPAPPFTGIPLPWNAYTYLDNFLLDGGKALTLVLVALTGLLTGLAWSFARRHNRYGAIAYAFSVPVLIFSYRQNLMDTFVIYALVAMGLLWISARFALRGEWLFTLRSFWSRSW